MRLIQNSENAHLEDVVIGPLATVIRMMTSLRDGLSLRGVGNRLYDYRSQFGRGVSNDAVYKIIRSYNALNEAVQTQ